MDTTPKLGHYSVKNATLFAKPALKRAPFALLANLAQKSLFILRIKSNVRRTAPLQTILKQLI
jgi:hypothetical protein